MGELGVEREVVVMEVEGEDDGSEEVRWENFLPRMVLRVLLVEADDSTRQVISALLRKCNYKVSAISDGLKAWEILKRQHGNIDLILTELDLPSISGYALLTLIMEHDGCKNIPVIIMSSQDSISMVLKCMLKGAADFLIKPVRKNELKNLWRHVWRRLAINAGHSPQNLTTEEHKVEATFENVPAINHSSDNVSSSQKSSKLSEKDTDAHSSCTTRYLEAESACVENMQDFSQRKNREDTGLNHKDMKPLTENVKLEKELALCTSVMEDKADKLGSQVQPYKEVNASAAFRNDEDGSCNGIATDDGNVGPENDRYRCNIGGHELPDRSGGAMDLIGRINKRKNTAGRASTGEFDGLNSVPKLELSLRRSHESETKEVDERHILNHSSASAFSWYSSNKKPRTLFPSSVGELTKHEGAADSPPWPKIFSSNGENKPPSPQNGLVPLPGVVFDGGVWASYGPMFQPMFGLQTGPTPRSPNSALQREESPFLTSPALNSDPGTHSSTGQAGDKTAESVDRHGCSSSYVLDRSGSSAACNDASSQHKISAHGSVSETTDVNASTSVIKGTDIVEESLGDEGGKAFVHDQFRPRMAHHSAEREAALAKFRLKRKGRCYEKKVRYQSRKRLAEQRPRVKGQFVRRVPTDEVLAADDKPID